MVASTEKVSSCQLCGKAETAPRNMDAFGTPLCSGCVNKVGNRSQNMPGFWLVDLLGQGGSSIVQLALRKCDGLPMAIKTPVPSVSTMQSEMERFLSEAAILRRLNHPNILRFLDQGTVNGQFFFAMEHVRGVDAGLILAKEGAIQVNRAVQWTCQLLTALGYLHELRIVHCNVQPANLLLTRIGNQEVLKLTGFHNAKDYSREQPANISLPGEVRGPLAFMAPEQITNFRDAQPPVDQYAAAATLYNLIANQYIYDMPDRLQQVLQMMLNDPPVPILKRRSDLPPGLAAAIDRALQREPADRFPNVHAFREALEPYQS